MAFDLIGNWNRGKAYDLHTISSVHLGIDEFGHDRFDNIRSKMGELVYRLKYRFDRTVLPRIVELLDAIGGIESFDFIVPIPPAKKDRPFQPVHLIAEALGGRRSVAVLPDLLTNDGSDEIKGISDPVERGGAPGKGFEDRSGTRPSRQESSSHRRSFPLRRHASTCYRSAVQ